MLKLLDASQQISHQPKTKSTTIDRWCKILFIPCANFLCLNFWLSSKIWLALLFYPDVCPTQHITKKKRPKRNLRDVEFVVKMSDQSTKKKKKKKKKMGNNKRPVKAYWQFDNHTTSSISWNENRNITWVKWAFFVFAD